MAKVESVFTSLNVHVSITCDCGESIDLNGIYVDETCECGKEFSIRIGHDGHDYKVIIKEDGKDLEAEEISF